MTNVTGLRNFIQFTKLIKDLDAFVYVSSVYANCNKSFIEEKIYPSNTEPQKILNLLEWMEEDWLKLATKKLIGDKPNTFTYTKWVAETLLEQEATDLPVVIVRPSIIGASWKEPFSVKIEFCKFPA